MIRPIPWRAAIALAYMGGIFLLSSLPGRQLASWGIAAYLFDLAHTPLYAGLTWVTLWSLVGPAGARSAFVAVIVMTFAFSDEWHQSFVPGRVFSFDDLRMDAIGVAISIGFQGLVQAGVLLRRGDRQL